MVHGSFVYYLPLYTSYWCCVHYSLGLVTFLVCTDGVTAGSPTLCTVVGHVVDVVVVGRVALARVGVQCLLHIVAGGMYLGISVVSNGANLYHCRFESLRNGLLGRTNPLF